MPQYYPPPENWQERGKIKITYKPAWRNWPLVRNVIDYRDGDRVEFRIQIEKVNAERRPHYVYEIFRGKINNAFVIDGVDTDISGNRIEGGDISYKLGYKPNNTHDPIMTESFLTAQVLGWDTFRSNVFWMIVSALIGGIITLATGAALGFVEIEKFWRIWIPPLPPQ